jgi:hypothetical protein
VCQTAFNGTLADLVAFANPSGLGGASRSDLSGDGRADIAWYSAWKNNGEIDQLITNSAGSGPAVLQTFVSGYGRPDWAGVGDFNGDGKTDIAWYEAWNNGTIKVNFSNGSGIGSSTNWVSGWGQPDWAAVA